MAATAHQIEDAITATAEKPITDTARKSTLLVYIKASLADEGYADITELLTNVPGIHGAQFALKKPNVMVVQFAPAQIHCKTILEILKTTGLVAKIVGC